MSIPFATVTATSDTDTHLVALSPALRGTRPDVLPTATLCGRATSGPTTQVHPANASCSRCFDVVPLYMALPAFEVVAP
ncbi:hypothetical protein ACQFYA_20820 [Promicromonospora sp. Marseille-Q5078]